MTKAAFVIPGDIDLPTGGYTYDRRVLALLPATGVSIKHVALAGSFPSPSVADLAESLRILDLEDVDTVLLIDGLAFGAMPDDLIRRIKQQVVALCHHPLALEAGLSPGVQAALKASETAALALARHVVVTSPMTRQIVAAEFGVPGARITVAEPGTDPGIRSQGTEVGTGVPRLLAVGSIVPRKGYDVLIRALQPLAGRRWDLVIAGSDDRSLETTHALRQAIAAAGFSERVRMLGAVEQGALDRLYGEADIFVMPSLFEGYGMVLGEAMARGLPIICTTGGAAADTAPETAALKVPPGDAAAFSAALLRVLDDSALRRQMADASWKAGVTLPRWSDTARVIADVLRRVKA